MFDLLTPGKKISLLASIGIAFMMLTAFVAFLSEESANMDWGLWLCYYSSIAYAVILFFSELDLKTNNADIARAATCLFTLAGTVGMVCGVPLVAMIFFILAFLASAASVFLHYSVMQEWPAVRCILMLALFLLMLFMIILQAGGGSATLILLMVDIPSALVTIAAAYNAYRILQEA